MNLLMVRAIKRRADRPDIYKPIEKLKKGQGYSEETLAAINDMVEDLKFHFRELDPTKISRIIGVSRKLISNMSIFDDEEEEDKEAACADSLSALCKEHPGGFETQADFTSRTMSGLMPDERTGPVGFTAPAFRDRYRRADQSHTIRRPITLATQPYSVAA